jgi:uncharacterized integral membrane protein
MTEPDAAERPAPTSPRPLTAAERRDRSRMVAAGLIGVLVAVFALLNLGDVKVHWLLATGQTPLIVVVGLAFALGMATDRLLVVRAARRKRRTES